MWFGCALNDLKIPENHSADEIHSKFQDDVTKVLSSYLKPTGELSGSKMIENYFPTVDADVFICHSHNDEAKAKNFAGWLYEHFKLRAFVDSMVWGSADDLLKKIDDIYCYNLERKSYCYENRNLSTSYVHMMLASSLANMMDKCICLFFIESKQTIKASNIMGTKETFSPWIFYELALFHKIQKKVPQELMHFSKIATEHRSNVITEATMERLNIALKAETKDLQNLYSVDLESWKQFGSEGKIALCELHKLLFHKK